MSKITTNYPLAGWAVITDANGKDEVVGMVSVTGGGQNSIMPGVCRLVIVPPVEGTYKHASEIEKRTETEWREKMKAEFTVFEDAPGYWFVPLAVEAAAIAAPGKHRRVAYPTKIAACRAALAEAVTEGATELHLHGMGSTISIKADAKAKGIKPFVYWPSVTTRIAQFVRVKRSWNRLLESGTTMPVAGTFAVLDVFLKRLQTLSALPLEETFWLKSKVGFELRSTL